MYAYGFSPQDQAARVAEYALASGKARIAVLVPNSPLGLSVAAAVKETLAAKGQTVAAEATYAPQGLGLEAAVNKLVPAGNTPDFTALVLAEGGPMLNTLLRTLAARDASLPNVQLLGVGIWVRGLPPHRPMPPRSLKRIFAPPIIIRRRALPAFPMMPSRWPLPWRRRGARLMRRP